MYKAKILSREKLILTIRDVGGGVDDFGNVRRHEIILDWSACVPGLPDCKQRTRVYLFAEAAAKSLLAKAIAYTRAEFTHTLIALLA